MKIHPLILLILATVIGSCTYENRIPDISSKKDAFSVYEKFQDNLCATQGISISDLIKALEKWKILEDTVLYFMIEDNTLDKSKSAQDIVQCATIGNNISDQILRLSDSELRSYKDIVLIQQSFNDFNSNIANSPSFREAEEFFNLLNNKPLTIRTAQEAFVEYTNQLAAWYSEGFVSKKEMLNFILEEDSLFSNFLNHLYEYDDKSVYKIIKGTTEVVELLNQTASDKKIDSVDLIAYMAIRTNRRMIQNAKKCMSSVKKKQLKTREQAAMTISMLLNPYSNYNQLCIATRTKKQVNELYILGEQMESLFDKLRKQNLIGGLILDSIPNKLIKEHILNTMK